MAPKTRKTPHPIILRLNKLAARDRLTNQAIGDKLLVTEGSIRAMRKRGRPPKNRHVLAALEKWLDEEAA